MPHFERAGVALYYEEFGTGYPVLLFAPGGMRSAISYWHQSPFDPTKELAQDFRVIAMDQRNAGHSTAAIGINDDWATYTEDHLALLDHLGIASCHVMGGCIGSSYCLALIQAAPDRISSAVLQNPIGLNENNRDDFRNMFNDWARELMAARSDIDRKRLEAFEERMFGGQFVFSVSRDFVRSCATPLLILAGDDNFHPTQVAEEISALAISAGLIYKWNTPDVVGETVGRVRSFLRTHMPDPSRSTTTSF